MKKNILVLTLFIFLISNTSRSQYIKSTHEFKSLTSSKKNSHLKINALPSTGASAGLNLGFASVEGEVGFAIGAFLELKAKGIAFVPQANYWNVKSQSNFELAGLARFYLTQKALTPYLDGGLGVNFYNSDKNDFTKLSVLVGGGIELANLGTAFNLLFDGKYKLIINDNGNLSCFIFTAGMKFPFK